MSQDYQTC